MKIIQQIQRFSISRKSNHDTKHSKLKKKNSFIIRKLIVTKVGLDMVCDFYSRFVNPDSIVNNFSSIQLHANFEAIVALALPFEKSNKKEIKISFFLTNRDTTECPSYTESFLLRAPQIELYVEKITEEVAKLQDELFKVYCVLT